MFRFALCGSNLKEDGIQKVMSYRIRLDTINAWFDSTGQGLRQQWFDTLRPPLTDPSPEALQRREEAWQQWRRTDFRDAVSEPDGTISKASNLVNFIRDNVRCLHELVQHVVVLVGAQASRC